MRQSACLMHNPIKINSFASLVNWPLPIGVGRFRILGGQGLEYWGGAKGGAKFPVGTWRRNDVDAT